VPPGQATPALRLGRSAPLVELPSCRSRGICEIERDERKKEMGTGEKINEIRILRER
jgi:hypothetical protein